MKKILVPFLCKELKSITFGEITLINTNYAYKGKKTKTLKRSLN